jgi:hypothetical protein
MAASAVPIYAAQGADVGRAQVEEWLDNNKLVYQDKDNGGIAIGFKGDNVEQIGIQIDFSDEFIHITAPVGTVPDTVDESFYLQLIKLTGPVLMVKPIIDEESLLYLAIDLPKTAASEDEIISDLAFMVDFIDRNLTKLRPWAEENES